MQNTILGIEICKEITLLGFPKTERCYLGGLNDFSIVKYKEGWDLGIDCFVCPNIDEILHNLPDEITSYNDPGIYRFIMEYRNGNKSAGYMRRYHGESEYLYLYGNDTYIYSLAIMYIQIIKDKDKIFYK